MISHGEGFVAQHKSGVYLVTWRWAKTIGRARCEDPNTPDAMIFATTLDPFAASLVHDEERFRDWLRREHFDLERDGWQIVPGPGCIVCGCRWLNPFTTDWHGHHRCAKHKDRNPCAIEGCQRTTAVKSTTGADRYLCGPHWKIACPPHSGLRRTYNRFWRIAKKQGGWDAALNRRFNRFWKSLIRRARGGREVPEEFLDEDEINRMFGWDQ